MNIDINIIIITRLILLCVEILTINIGLVNNLETPVWKTSRLIKWKSDLLGAKH
jgi:hypothetical protein